MIANLHTIAELTEWIAAIDYQIGEIQRAADEAANAWATRDPQGAATWLADWGAMRQRYALARALAMTAITKAKLMPVPNTAIPCEIEWDAVKRALRQREDTETRGDLQELYRRFVQARGGAQVDLRGTPQPHATDVDLATFQTADSVVRSIESGAPVAALVVGGAIVLGLLLATKVKV